MASSGSDSGGGHGDQEELGEELGGDIGLAEPEQEIQEKLRRPPRYAVVLHNDDYTTMEFVVEVLKRYFHKNETEAMQIVLRVHQEGRGVAGIYSFEIAETKAAQVNAAAQARGFPLKSSIEPEE